MDSTNDKNISAELIAPCGMNCGVCLHYLRKENECPGCFTGRKVNDRPMKCGRRLCKERKGDFCFECHKFPCDSIKRLDQRYRTKYNMSEIDNLEFIKNKGMKEFIKSQKQKYQCDKGIFCVHDKNYYK